MFTSAPDSETTSQGHKMTCRGRPHAKGVGGEVIQSKGADQKPKIKAAFGVSKGKEVLM